MIMNNLFILSTLKTKFSWNISASLTCYVHILLDWSPITLPLANIGQDFCLIILLHAHATILLSKQGCISVYSIWNHGIPQRCSYVS